MDKYQIAANIALAGLDGFDGKMSAVQQRQVFGAALFGKKTITIHNQDQGKVEVRYSVAYGTDQAWTEVTFDQIAAAVVTNRPLSF